MTQEHQDKKAFFAHYYGQEVFLKTKGSVLHTLTYDRLGSITVSSCLLLKPLSSISDEDAIEVAKIFFPEALDGPYTHDRTKDSVSVSENSDLITIWFDNCEVLHADIEQMPVVSLQAYDYLRSRGYLLPFRQFSTQQLLDMGWAKIKEG